MTKGAVARRYASALFELLAAADVEPVRKGLAALAEAASRSAPLRHVLASPAFSLDEKAGVLAELSDRLGCPEVMKRFLRQLAAKNRMGAIAGIAEAFAALADRTKGVEAVTVWSAVELTPAEQRRLADRLRELMRSQVLVTCQTDPHLISGLQVRVGSRVYDSSIRSRLETMRTLLAKE